MHFAAASLLLLQTILLVGRASSEELKASDVPSACTTICKPIVQLTNTCDVDPGKMEDKRRDMDNGMHGDMQGDKSAESDEPIEAQCICNNKSFNVASIAALCASCMKQNGQTGSDDMDNIMSACSFSSKSYAPSATALVAQITVQATKPAFTATAAGSSAATASGKATGIAASKGLGARAGVPSVLGLGVTLFGLVVGAAEICLF